MEDKSKRKDFGMKPKEFYSYYEKNRQQYIDRAEEFSKISLPYVMAPDFTYSDDYDISYIQQSYGGRLVNTLVGKMVMALLPPTSSSFRFQYNKNLLSNGQIPPEQITQAVEMIDNQISSVTKSINDEIENQQLRDSAFDMCLQLTVVGSCIIEKVKDDGIMVHSLQSFTANLDAKGRALGICILEKRKDPIDDSTIDWEEVSKDEDGLYNLYTLCRKIEGEDKWEVSQAIDEFDIGEPKTYTSDKVPFVYIGWKFVYGDKYHRPYIEDYYCDLKQYNKLSYLLTDGSLVAAKTLLFVDERGNVTKKKDVAKSANGDVINGRASDVTALQLGKNYDFQVPMERLQDLGRNLANAFLMNEGARRDAERVTAEEIRLMAQELESSNMSGVYSKLSKSFSKQIVLWIMQELKIDFKEIQVNVITGLDALGRSQEAQKLDSFLQRMVALGYNGLLKEQEVVSRFASFDGIDTNGLIKTSQEIQAERQQQQQALVQEQLAQQAMGRSGKPIMEAMSEGM